MSKILKISDQDIESMLCKMPEECKSLSTLCKENNVSFAHILRRINESPYLDKLYLRARENFAHAHVDKLFQITQEEPDVQRARLMCDNIKWFASKVVPKFYGEKMQLSGDKNNPVQIVIDVNQANDIRSFADSEIIEIDDEKKLLT